MQETLSAILFIGGIGLLVWQIGWLAVLAMALVIAGANL